MVRTKQCTRCDMVKSILDFPTRSASKDGRGSVCKSCKKLESSTRYRNKNKTEIKNKYLQQKYGLTLEEYNLLFVKQEGKCAICGKHQTELKKGLFVDHDHETGEVRSLLCTNCNTGLGLFKDNIELLNKGIEYLKKYE